MTLRHGVRGYANKLDLLQKAVAGKQVVHLGAVGMAGAPTSERVAALPTSVHAFITRHAARCVGVDIAEEAVRAAAAGGQFDNIICADATTLSRASIPLDQIDVIVAGDIIEHLANPGGLLASCWSWADPQTILALTTPNAVGLPLIARYSLGRVVDGGDHLCSFNVYTLTQLLERSGWQIDELFTCHQAQASPSAAFGFAKRVLASVPQFGGTLFAQARRIA
jgi:hypothetical protein